MMQVVRKDLQDVCEGSSRMLSPARFCQKFCEASRQWLSQPTCHRTISSSQQQDTLQASRSSIVLGPELAELVIICHCYLLLFIFLSSFYWKKPVGCICVLQHQVPIVPVGPQEAGTPLGWIALPLPSGHEFTAVT